ncbi:MAG: crossover junction endodeoxyribonuclease RuvC [Candidatus Omnitrophota bacterium]
MGVGVNTGTTGLPVGYSMRILGIDPGLLITGYGVIEESNESFKLIEAGIVRTESKYNITQRIAKIYNALSKLIDEVKPQALVLEKLYSHYRHPTTAVLLGHARGVICLLAHQKNIEFFEYPYTRIHKAILGRGSASKSQIQGMVCDLLNLKQLPNKFDITDALAMAIAHAYIRKVKI